jgi:hypothetical protein
VARDLPDAREVDPPHLGAGGAVEADRRRRVVAPRREDHDLRDVRAAGRIRRGHGDSRLLAGHEVGGARRPGLGRGALEDRGVDRLLGRRFR